MDDFKKKKLEQQTPEERMAGLQQGAGFGFPKMPIVEKPADTRMTQDDEDRMRMVQEMQLANSPTKGMVQPNAADLAGQQSNFDSMLSELGDGVEVPKQPIQKSKRFQRILGQ